MTSHRRLQRLCLFVAGFALLATLSACGGSTSADEGSTDRNAAADCEPTVAPVEKRTAVEVVNRTSFPIIVQVPPRSWDCNSFIAAASPAILNMEVPAGQTVRKEVWTYDNNFKPLRLAQMSFLFRTPMANGRGSSIISFGSDSTMTSRWGTQNAMYSVGYQTRVGALSSDPVLNNEGFFSQMKDWQGSWTGAVDGTTAEGKPVKILWDGTEPYSWLRFTIEDR